MTRNLKLAAALREHGFTQQELAERLNAIQYRRTGRYGTLSDKSVRRWLSGECGWPHARQRDALMEVFKCPVEDLGFVPRCRRRSSRAPEEPVERRTFIGATAVGVATAAFAPSVAAAPVVGMSDARRLEEQLAGLDSVSNSQGGHRALELAALEGAAACRETLAKSASQRVRARIDALAAQFVAVAAWSCIDTRDLQRASRHAHTSLTLAGMSGDGPTQIAAWNTVFVIANQRAQHADSLAALRAAAATTTAKRDPFFASMLHGKAAGAHAALGERQSALRHLGRASDTLGRAENRERPTWTSFYGSGELHTLSAKAHLALGDPTSAEYAAHHALTSIPAKFPRNRGFATIRLAFAQLHQGERELAAATANSAQNLARSLPDPGRLNTMLAEFRTALGSSKCP
ncbi:twin-arginine translocation signal domain-containing protein [Yinghuangia sp. YIM S09857]|uniref:twin-arginine translocation signal domain-containing protein n=1 Tax=Yinghuangia sp. YIM S09857 TaxID=3436929 RepID=UPI003F534902